MMEDGVTMRQFGAAGIKLLGVFFAISGLASAAAFDPAILRAQAAQLLVTGHQLGEGSWSGAGGEWLALQPQDGEFAVRAATVRVDRETPICGDIGFNVSADGLPTGTFLMRGIPALHPGPVTTLFAGRRYVPPGDSLRPTSSEWRVSARGTVKPAINAGRDETLTTGYVVSLVKPGRTGRIFSLPGIDNDGPPEILWVGNLDGDDVPDILADVRTHYAGHHYTLFLSSAAKAGQLVAQVAVLATLGC
jgi:hypothetical protein